MYLELTTLLMIDIVIFGRR